MGINHREQLWRGTYPHRSVDVRLHGDGRRLRRQCPPLWPPALLLHRSAFFLAALASLLGGLHVLPLGQEGWHWILNGAAVGALLACCALEGCLGKYTNPHSSGA